jgi:nicotinate dehydrogenase subunit B
MTQDFALSRRDLLKAGGALIVYVGLLPQARLARAAATAQPPGSLATAAALDAWIRINADGTVTAFTGKVEIGQGITTALAQVVAEELDVSLDRLRLVTADTERTPNEGYTSGSWSMAMSGTALRLAAAQARFILLRMAAAELGAPPDRLQVQDGTVTLPGSQQHTTYWDLMGGRFFRYRVTGSVPPKPPATHRLVGSAVPRLDIPAKVSGGIAYVQDLRLPGMVHARVVRAPSYGATLLSFDEAAVAGMPGVLKIVRDGSYLAVIAEQEWQAIQAHDKLVQSAKWEERPTLPAEGQLYDFLVNLPTENSVILDKPPAHPAAARRFEAIYRRPYAMHGAIGPSCAVGLWQDDALTVWTHSQGVYPLRRSLAGMLRLPEGRIRCIHMEGSGCYGQNGADDAAADAALLARALPGRPVRVQWMRQDEHSWEPYGPAMVMRAQAAVADDGAIVEWNYEVWSPTHSARPDGSPLLMPQWHLEPPGTPPPSAPIPQPQGGGDRNAIPLYDIPSGRIVHHFIPAVTLRSSALRSLGAYGNVFAIESFMDELAASVGADPVAYRLRHLKDPRGAEVIKAAAERFGWSNYVAPPGRGRGFGFARYKNEAAYTAVAAEVAVDRTSGQVRVLRLVAADDSGEIVNPDGVRNQIEGGIVQATSWTLKEAVRFDRTRITSRDWSSYPILTFPEVPAEVEVVLVDRPGQPFLGTGEAAQGPTVAAIANAVAHATGVRIRELPLTPARVLAALQQSAAQPSGSAPATGGGASR